MVVAVLGTRKRLEAEEVGVSRILLTRGGVAAVDRITTIGALRERFRVRTEPRSKSEERGKRERSYRYTFTY